MHALLDGDIFAFRVGFSCEAKDEGGEKVLTVPLQIAFARCRDMIVNCLTEVGVYPDETDNYHIFLTDSDGNFRKTVSPDYKANRKDIARPQYLPELEKYLIKEWGALRAVEQEADDLLGIYQTKFWERGEESVICSIDKDLKQIPGMHYNFVTCKTDEVDQDRGEYFFYKQLLMGDPTDNIGGCPGIGPKKADKALEPFYGDPMALYQAVRATYKQILPEIADEELSDLLLTVGRLVYIRRHENELWVPPQLGDKDDSH